MTRRPNFLVIGAQKCGTTWIHRHLGAHPEIFLPPDKDQTYFFFCAERAESSVRRHAMQFAGATRRQLAIGETSAAYFWTRTGSAWDHKPEDAEPDIVERIRSELGPDARFLLALRDPVERAVSAYFHYQAHGELSPDASLMGAAAFKGIVDMGFYARHLSNWLAHYPREQLLILSLEQDIGALPRETLRRAFGFLGVDPGHVARAIERRVFAGRTRHWRDDGVWVRDGDGSERIAVDGATLSELRAIYRSDIGELTKMLGREFVAPWRMMEASA